MPLQEMGSVLLGVYWWGVFEKSCVCSRSGQQVWKLPNRAPALFCYYIFLGTWRGSKWARCGERPSAGLCFIWVIAGLRLRIRFIIIFLSNLQLCMPDIWWSPLVGVRIIPVLKWVDEGLKSRPLTAFWQYPTQSQRLLCDCGVIMHRVTRHGVTRVSYEIIQHLWQEFIIFYHRLQVRTVQGADKMCISYQSVKTSRDNFLLCPPAWLWNVAGLSDWCFYDTPVTCSSIQPRKNALLDISIINHSELESRGLQGLETANQDNIHTWDFQWLRGLHAKLMIICGISYSKLCVRFLKWAVVFKDFRRQREKVCLTYL